MRILHFLNHTRRANGHVEIAVDLACAQAAQGHDVAVMSGPGDFMQCLNDNGVTFAEIERTDGKLGALSMAMSLARFARTFRADIVNAHMVKAAVVARGVQVRRNYRLVTTVHNSFDRQSRLMAVGDRVIAVSEAVKKEMVEKGIPARKLRTVRNGTIGGKRRPTTPAMSRELSRPSIATVCGLHPRKGVVDLIDAFAITADSHPEAHLYVVGSGPQHREIEQKVDTLRCRDRIHLLGYLKDPREVLVSSDVFALASHADPCPLAICEARQMGCAIVATNVGGIPEMLAFGKLGMLVPPRDPRALARALSAMLGDPALRQQFASAARSDLEECQVDKMSRQTIAVYGELL